MKNPFRIGRKFDAFFADWELDRSGNYIFSPNMRYLLRCDTYEIKDGRGWEAGKVQVEPLLDGVTGWLRTQFLAAAKRRYSQLLLGRRKSRNAHLLQVTGNAGKQSIVDMLLRK